MTSTCFSFIRPKFLPFIPSNLPQNSFSSSRWRTRLFPNNLFNSTPSHFLLLVFQWSVFWRHNLKLRWVSLNELQVPYKIVLLLDWCTTLRKTSGWLSLHQLQQSITIWKVYGCIDHRQCLLIVSWFSRHWVHFLTSLVTNKPQLIKIKGEFIMYLLFLPKLLKIRWNNRPSIDPF